MENISFFIFFRQLRLKKIAHDRTVPLTAFQKNSTKSDN